MEKFKTLIALMLMITTVSAYDSSLVNSSETIGWDEIPERMNDNIIKGNNNILDNIGGVIGGYVALIFYAFIIGSVLWAFKRWLN